MAMALPIRPPLSSATTLGYRVAMAEIVNLRLARKARARTEAEGKAAANRAAHGQTKAERAAAQAHRDALARRVDQHRRERGED
jgi:hypothetical protein